MSTQSIEAPFVVIPDIDGQPLENGSIYIGTAGLNAITNQIQVYFDTALSVVATQPISTRGGYPINASGAITRIYVNAADYSMSALNKNGSVAQSSLSITEKISSSGLTYQLSATGSSSRTMSSKFSDIVSVKDFGAVGDGVTDDTAAFVSAIAFCGGIMPVASPSDIDGKALYVPQGLYMVDADALVIEDKQSLRIFGDTTSISSEKTYGSMIKCRTAGDALITLTGEAYNIEFQHLIFNMNGIADKGLKVQDATCNYNSIYKCQFFLPKAGGTSISCVSALGVYTEAALWDITDCGFDSLGAASAVNLYNAGAWEWVFTRCHFDAVITTAHCIFRCAQVSLNSCTFDNAGVGASDIQVYATSGAVIDKCHSGSAGEFVQMLAAVGGDATTWLNYPVVIRDSMHTSLPATSVSYNSGTQPLQIDGLVCATGSVVLNAGLQKDSSVVNCVGFTPSWTPVISSSAGTITSYTATGKYQKVGKLCSVTCSFTITDNGTGSGYLIVEGFPFSAQDAASICGGSRNGTTSEAVNFTSSGVANTLMTKYDGTYPVATGNVINFTVTYLTA